MKTYRILMSRTYNTSVEVNFPDDGRDHAEIINDKIEDQDHEIWDLIAEAELFQMNVDNENWDFLEIIKDKPPISEWTMHTKYDK